MLNAVGGVLETVKLDGDDAGISEEELERSVASFPIHTVNNRSRMR